MEKNKPAREELENLLAELKFLRTTLKDVSEAFILRTEGEIETLASYLVGLTPKECRQIGHTWLKEVRSTTFKPAKGRFKDLKKIDHLLENLLEQIIDCQSGPHKRPPVRKQSLSAPIPEQNA